MIESEWVGSTITRNGTRIQTEHLCAGCGLTRSITHEAVRRKMTDEQIIAEDINELVESSGWGHIKGKLYCPMCMRPI